MSFASHALHEPCGASNITLNGVYLAQEWDGDFASGYGNHQAAIHRLPQNAKLLQHDLELEWHSACLHGADELVDAAQVVTVSINSIDGKPVTTPSGFTISFKQQTTPPSLLRLEPVPNPSASNSEVAASWREPLQPLRLSPPIPAVELRPVDSQSLEDQIRELKALEAELFQLQAVIAEKKKQLNSRFRKQVKNLAQDLNRCHSITCIVKTIARKARGAWGVAHLRSQLYRHNLPDMERPEQIFASAHGRTTQNSGDRWKVESLDSLTDQPSANLIYPIGSSTDSGCFTARGACSTLSPQELPARSQKPSPFLLGLEIALGILCCGCLLTVIQNKCSKPRTRTERAVAREERFHVQTHSRAARHHTWRHWWHGNWRTSRYSDSERIIDYEEKRALIQEEEGVLEDAMQDEIRQLRAAHELVNDLVRDAEEGRVGGQIPCRCYSQHQHCRGPYSPLSNASTYPPTSLPEIPSRPLSPTESLPSYRSGDSTQPPSYESDTDMFEPATNGFRNYPAATESTTSETSSHWTPDSSIVDVSPRPSAETLQYPYSLYSLVSRQDDSSDPFAADLPP